jgi:hypothetical protein
MAVKTCFKCKGVKPLTSFYKHPKMKDGFLGKCKKCAKEDITENISKRRQDLNWVLRERSRCRNKTKRYRQLGLAKVYIEPKRKWAKQNKHKRKAQYLARKALLRGDIERKTSCEKCNNDNVKLSMHHPDYNFPLIIIWLCSKCHGQEHWKTIL